MVATSHAAAMVCFVDMPFGKKVDPSSGVEIDFNQVYETGIEPAIRNAGLQSIRGDKEQIGGIIHQAMFARLLLSEFVIADLTTANANVFYELGVRHAAKPYTTIPIFAPLSAIPFDVHMVRAIPYELEGGELSAAAADKLRSEITARIRRALEGPVAKDSPLFQLFEGFPGIDIGRDLTDVFADRMQVSEVFQEKIDEALESEPKEQALERVKTIEAELGDLSARDSEVLVRMLLTYRDLSAWDEMVDLYEKLPASLKDGVMARQQLALALNRRAGAGDRKRAIRILRDLLKDRGESAETYGILGRIYKDEYREAKRAESATAPAHLDNAIDAYTRGFECEPGDYYPGVNAINLLVQKGTEDTRTEIDRLTPIVSFAVARRGGAASEDYWTLATVLELALIGRDYDSAESVLPKVLVAAKAGWMVKTTVDNLNMVLALRKHTEDTSRLQNVIAALRKSSDGFPGA